MRIRVLPAVAPVVVAGMGTFLEGGMFEKTTVWSSSIDPTDDGLGVEDVRPSKG